MALYDDKRFILSHIRHSFITCDDTCMSETVMLNEPIGRYPPAALYHTPFDYDSDEEFYYGVGGGGGVYDEDEEDEHEGGDEEYGDDDDDEVTVEEAVVREG